VIYARVSSKEQEKEGFSIPAQLKLLREYAAAQGFTVAQEYVDVETAKQTGRAAFGEMVAYLGAHPAVRVLMVEKTDRLYRNLKDWVVSGRPGLVRDGQGAQADERSGLLRSEFV
jgi:site-specific DNA recombinase